MAGSRVFAQQVPVMDLPPCPNPAAHNGLPGTPGAPGTPGSPGGGAFSLLTAADVAAWRDMVQRVRHWMGPAVQWITGGITISQTTTAVPLIGSDAKRVALQIVLPAGVTAYYGPNVAITAGTGANSGQQLPAGGGWVNGPELGLAVYLILASGTAVPVTVTYSSLLTDVPYPGP